MHPSFLVGSFYTAGCGNKMVVSVTGPRAVNELGGPVIPGILTCLHHMVILKSQNKIADFSVILA